MNRPAPLHSAEELEALSASFEDARPEDILSWALSEYGKDIVLACSFQDCVLIEMATTIDPSIEVVFLDTGAHFPETMAFVETVRSHFNLNLTVTTPPAEAAAWQCGSSRCCEIRKVEPLRSVLSQKSAWITALKRCDAPTRANAPICSFDSQFGLVKINPLATWSDENVETYRLSHDLPAHPLIAMGYPSIGCAPTTRPVAPGEHPRSGRFTGMEKTECGLHLPASPSATDA